MVRDGLRADARVAGIRRCRPRDAGHAALVLVAAGQQRRPRRRAQRD